MAKIFSMQKTTLSFIVALFTGQMLNAQCPVITAPSTCSFGCTTPTLVTATSNYSANVTSRWIGPGNIPIASLGTSTSVVNINAAGTYTVEFKDNSSNCVVTSTLLAVSQSSNPMFGISAGSFTQNCPNSILILNIVNGNTFPVAGGPISYTFGSVTNPLSPAPGTLAAQSNFSVNTCGNYYFVTRDNVNFCQSSYTLSIGCSTVTLPVITVSGNNTVCLGSSTTLSVTGANSYSWSNNSNASSVTLSPSISSCFSVTGTNGMGCTASASTCIVVDTTCSQVWPGDANSDGIVDNADVFEIGLAFNQAGPLRIAGNNFYTGQFANNWSGTVSSGKNKCHADCNGNGIVNLGDTLAIFNNYFQTHAFKLSAASSNPDIKIISTQNFVNAGQWNKVSVHLGDAENAMNQIYGVAFDVNFDKALIEADSIYIVYPASFLYFSLKNVLFRKPDFSAGKIYAANVRTDGSNISGYGKIAEIFFKIKSGLQDSSIFNLSVSNVKKINNTGVNSTLTGGAATLSVRSNPDALKETEVLNNTIPLFPNPSTGKLILQSELATAVNYYVYDLLGREILKGEFTNSKTLDIGDYENGTYIVRFESGKTQVYKKLVIEK